MARGMAVNWDEVHCITFKNINKLTKWEMYLVIG